MAEDIVTLDTPNKSEDNLTKPLQPETDLTVGTAEPPVTVVEQRATNYWPEIQAALSEGYNRQEIATYLNETKQLDLDEADKQVINSVQDKMTQAAEQGYTASEVQDYLISNRYDPEVVISAMNTAGQQKTWDKYNWQPGQNQEKAEELTGLYENVYGKYSTTGKQVLGFFDETAALEARKEINKLNSSIANKLQEQGFDAFISPDTGDLMLKHENGMVAPIESSMLNDLYNSKAEIAGSVSGAVLGAKKGAEIGTAAGATLGGIAGNLTGVGAFLPEEIVTIPGGAAVGKTIGTAVGAFAGGAFGASGGKAVDLTLNAVKLKEQLEADLYYTQMKEAAIADGIMSVVGAGALKMGGAGFKQVMKAYDFLLAGNSKGAYRALKDIMHISDEQAEEIVTGWTGKIAGDIPGRNPEEQAIAAITSTQQGAENLVKQAASKDMTFANNIIKNIDERAKDLIGTVENVATDAGKSLKQGLKTYTKDVKDFYGQVKQVAVDATDGTDFAYDLDKIAIQPVLDSIEKSLPEVAAKEQFVNYATRISNATEDRSFGSLIDLRQAVNDFKFSKTKLKKPAIDALNGVLNKIDTQLAKGAKEYIPEKNWQKLWTKAKSEYSQMKRMEKNVLYKGIMAAGKDEEAIRKVASKYIDAVDDTFDEVLDKLPPKVRSKAEGAAIKQLTNKYTLGSVTDRQAVHFPMLSEALKNTKIKSPEAKKLKGVIDEMAEVFKNDTNLSRVSGNVPSSGLQSALTDDLVVKAKWTLMSSLFNSMKKFVPFSRQARELSLVDKVGKLLRDPLKAKKADEFINSLPKDAKEEFIPLVKELQIEMAKTPQRQQDFQRMYKQSASGKFQVTKGALGKGLYLVDRVKNPTGKVIGQEVNMSRLATLENIQSLLGREVDVKEIKNIPNLQKELLDRGYNGIRLEGRAMLFPEQSTKKSIKQ